MAYNTNAFKTLMAAKSYTAAFQYAYQWQQGADCDQAMRVLTKNTQFGAFKNMYGGTATSLV